MKSYGFSAEQGLTYTKHNVDGSQNLTRCAKDERVTLISEEYNSRAMNPVRISSVTFIGSRRDLD